MLDDHRYDSTELGDDLDEHGTKPVIQKLLQQEATVQLRRSKSGEAGGGRECMMSPQGSVRNLAAYPSDQGWL